MERIDIIIVGSATLIIMLVILFAPSQLKNIEDGIRKEYNWDDPQYAGWDCSNKSVECEKYFETELNYSCYLVYGIRHNDHGDPVAHMWNLVKIDGIFYEFESTTLKFCKISDRYTIQTMQEGFYVNGMRYGIVQPLENWKELV